MVRDDVVWGIAGGRGIRTLTTSSNPSALDVVLDGNTVWCPGDAPSIALHDDDGRAGVSDLFRHVTAMNNVTDDGSAESRQGRAQDFAGPITGSADAGAGPGSGFRRLDSAHLGADLARIVGE